MMTNFSYLQNRELESIVVTLYEYQEFKADIAISKITSNHYSPNTLKSMYSSIRSFLNTGNYGSKKLPDKVYDTLLRLKREKHPTKVPSEYERGCDFGSRGRGSKIFTSKEPYDGNLVEAKMKDSAIKVDISKSTMNSIKHNSTNPIDLATPKQISIPKQDSLDESIGIRIGNIIKLFKNEDQLNGYLMACEDHKVDQEFKKVLIDIVPMED